MMTTKRLNISSLVYIIARYAELAPEVRDLNEINRLSGLAYVLGLVIIESVPFPLS